MNIIERSIALLAPHTCLACKREDSPLCSPCAKLKIIPPPARCYKCGQSSPDFATCAGCSTSTPIGNLWIGAEYTGIARQLVSLLKFQRTKAAAYVIAEWLNQQLPPLPPDIIVTTVPTVANRVRLRGYDQAQLISRQFAARRRYTYLQTLWRVKNTRQVGASRTERFAQLENAFKVRNGNQLRGQHLLVIDDVLTTGATLQTAAWALSTYQPAKIDAAVFAFKA